MTDTPDAQLLEQFARHQSEAAFGELVQRHIGLVYSVAFRKTGNPQQAEDITQAVFIVLARKADSLGAKTVLPGWLFHTARMTAANAHRAEMRRIRREQEAFVQSTSEESATATDTVWRELSPQLDEAMACLGVSERDALVLRYFQNKSVAEMGTLLGVQENTAQKRVGRALEKLRKFFAKRGVASTTAVIAGAISANSVQAAPVGLAQAISAAALAKGATASTSTLTLFKEALKIMAWNKAKTGLVITLLAILTVTSITIVGFMLAQNHRSTARPAAGLFPVAVDATGDIQSDGTVLCKGTLEEINNSRRTIRTDSITEAGTISRISDELGEPLKFVRLPDGRFLITLNKPVPPGGKVSYTLEGAIAGLVKANAAGEYEIGFADSAGNITNMHCVQIWRLPAGATLLGKNPEMQESTNDGQIELRIDKIVPPNGSFPVGFRYRLAARAPSP